MIIRTVVRDLDDEGRAIARATFEVPQTGVSVVVETDNDFIVIRFDGQGRILVVTRKES